MTNEIKGDYLTAKKTAEFLGISQSYLYKLTHNRALPFYKPNGKMLYFALSDLNEWIGKVRVAPAAEIEQRATDYVVTGRKGVQNV